VIRPAKYRPEFGRWERLVIAAVLRRAAETASDLKGFVHPDCATISGIV
jgi:hypothetical protein